jgi:hypothetical protein
VQLEHGKTIGLGCDRLLDVLGAENTKDLVIRMMQTESHFGGLAQKS